MSDSVIITSVDVEGQLVQITAGTVTGSTPIINTIVPPVGVISTPIIVGPPGPPGSGSSYIHDQTIAALTWTINHNLGFRPHVEVLTIGGMETITEVLHVSLNQVQVINNVAAAGFARLS